MVIHCDDVQAVLQRVPNHVGYILEYLVRFVLRLKLDSADKMHTLLMRFVAALTHQSVVIKGTTYPDAKLHFPKLRGGTADSTLKFMLRLKDMIQAYHGSSADSPADYTSKMFSACNNMDVDDNDNNSMKVNSSRQSSAIIMMQ